MKDGTSIDIREERQLLKKRNRLLRTFYRCHPHCQYLRILLPCIFFPAFHQPPPPPSSRPFNTNSSDVVTKPSSVTGKKVNSKWKKKHQLDHSSRYGHGASYLEIHPSRIVLLLAILMAGTLIFSHQMLSISNIHFFQIVFNNYCI